MRDEGLLESAIDRLRHRHVYGDAADHFDLAAAYVYGIVRNHPFVDGDKRTALLAGVVFLEMNGDYFAPNETDIVNVVAAAADGSIGEPEVAHWFRAHVS